LLLIYLVTVNAPILNLTTYACRLGPGLQFGVYCIKIHQAVSELFQFNGPVIILCQASICELPM